jgi:Transposase DDE domain group 1
MSESKKSSNFFKDMLYGLDLVDMDLSCYHPLFLFIKFGDLERCSLRPGNVHSAGGWDAGLQPVVARYQGKVSRIYLRADAGFATPEGYDFLEV